MRNSVPIAVAVLTVLAGGAKADCTCRANGQDFTEGQIACIRLPEGSYLARCGKVLNNTSWVRISDACPQAEIVEPGVEAPPAPNPG